MVGSHKRLFAKLEGRKLRSVIIRNEGKTRGVVIVGQPTLWLGEFREQARKVIRHKSDALFVLARWYVSVTVWASCYLSVDNCLLRPRERASSTAHNKISTLARRRGSA
jgi:hypothetical protein